MEKVLEKSAAAVQARPAITLLFFASGFAALLYQIAWQRALFGWYGVDLDSVSVIISVFMLGLGVGAFVGGWLADHFNEQRVFVFSLIELTIAVFGFFSLGIIDSIGELFSAHSVPRLVVLTFVVFVVPTCAMGATLPVLVTELAERSRNVGLSIGNLYFTNTLGAAAGAIMAGYVFLSIGGLDLVVIIATGLNLAVSVVAYAVCGRGL
jgi:predicted membrane-bound spermidine synthase